MQKRYLFIVALVAVFAVQTTWAGGQKEKAAAPQKQLSVVMRSGFKYNTVMKEYGPQFTKQTGIKLNMSYFPWEQMREKYITDFASKTGAYNVEISSAGWEGDFYKFYQPLGSYIKRDNYDINDYLPSALAVCGILQSPNHVRYGIPQKDETMTLYYRSDIFQKLGLGDPTDWNWNDFFKASDKIKASGLIKYPMVTAGVNVQLPKFMLAAYLPQGVPFMTPEGKPLFVNKEGVQALAMMKKIFSYGPPNYAAIDILQASQIFLIGDAAMLINWPAATASSLNDPNKSKIIGKWAATAPPGPGNEGIEGIYMTKSTPNKDAAWQFIKWFTSKDMTANVVKITGIPYSRKSLMTNPEVLNSVPGLKGALKADSRSFGWPAGAYPKGGAWFQDIGNQLGQYMAGGSSAENALKSISDEWYTLSGKYIGKIKWVGYFQQRGIKPKSNQG